MKKERLEEELRELAPEEGRERRAAMKMVNAAGYGKRTPWPW